MNTKSVRLIKKYERTSSQLATVASTAGPNKWSTAVRSWVVDFQRRERIESLPSFDSLFKDTLLSPERTD